MTRPRHLLKGPGRRLLREAAGGCGLQTGKEAVAQSRPGDTPACSRPHPGARGLSSHGVSRITHRHEA